MAQAIDTTLWVTDGFVWAVVRSGATIYLAGNFTHVGPATGGGVPINAASGVPLSSFPKVTGKVFAVVSDGAGGWFIGGTFSAVGGIPRSNIAHLASDLSVSAWNPSANDTVNALAMSGSTVYAGGAFGTIGGQARTRIAALNASSGSATSWNPGANATVDAITVDGTVVYAGGRFTTIGGQTRNDVAALDAGTGLATAWDPNANGTVRTLAVSGSAVYAGGTFTSIGGQTRNNIAALDIANGTATAWDPNADNIVNALAVSGSIVYAGGNFTSIGGQTRTYIAALNTTTGLATSWNPNSNNIVNVLAVNGSTVYAGGLFRILGGQTRYHIAALDAATGLATAWDPNADNTVLAIAASGGTVYIGGDLTSVGGQVRFHIASLDATTGAATSWSPNLSSSYVTCLAVSGNTVYAGGNFTSGGPVLRNYLAALDATTGAFTSWNPNPDHIVWAVAVSGSTVYAAGDFTSIGGQPRNFIAALDTATGAATSWAPNASASIRAVALSESKVYVGGSFTSVGGQPRNFIAALDSATGAATSWNPNANNSVSALAVSGSIVYAGGGFGSIGGQARHGIAPLDATSGLATAWADPLANNRVEALAANGSTIYAGGLFTSIAGQTRNRTVALNATGGAATSWDPNANNDVNALTMSGNTVYVGGNFTSIGGRPQAHIAAIWAMPDVQVVSPSSGGNSGSATLTLAGHNLRSGATAKLARSGQSDIVGTGTIVTADGLSISAAFDLTAKALGTWDVVVTNPDQQSATLPNGFTIDVFVAPQLRVDIVGPDSIRTNYPAAYDVVIQNPGNVDALTVPLWVTGIPTSATLSLGFAVAAPPQGGGEPDWSLVQDTLTTATGRYLALVIPRVPPGTVTRRVWVTAAGADTFTLRAALTRPWVDEKRFATCMVDGGVIGDGVCMGGQLAGINAYLAAHSEIAALNGVAVWAKVGWVCEGAGSESAALAEARQALGFMIQPVVSAGSIPGSCNDVLPPRWRDVLGVVAGGSVDPNDKFGEHGNGSVITSQTWLPYTIQFENLSTAPYSAQHVLVSDPLDADLDPVTVSLGRISFGSYHVDPPPASRTYTTPVSVGANLSVQVGLSLVGSQLVWSFDTFHPNGAPLLANEGFLPPNVTPPQGQGSVQFTVRPKGTVTSGTLITNQAVVTFDGVVQGSPMVSNTIDQTPPQSHVAAVAPTAGALSITASWVADSSPDVMDYTICVAEDGGPYRAWRTNTTVTTDTLGASSDHRTHSYAFYSLARDQVGNIEGNPTIPDASIASQVAVEPPGHWALALEGARPNPTIGDALHVWFTLPSRDRATLDLMDVAGRRVMRREVGSLGPGPHVVTLSAGPRLRSGLYFLRLSHGDQVMHARVVLMR